MKQSLNEINERYIKLEKYLFLSRDRVISLSEKERAEYSAMYGDLFDEYEATIKLFNSLIPTLSDQEILDGFHEGSEYLQRSLSGRMCQHYRSLYLNTMVEAIKEEKAHVAPHFLQALADILGREIIPIVLFALNSRETSIKRTALSVSEQLQIQEAIPQIKILVEDQNIQIAYLAKAVLTKMGG